MRPLALSTSSLRCRGITDQQVTNAAGVQSLGTNPFTISDLSYVWVVCGVV
jgi:hypothetical protein